MKSFDETLEELQKVVDLGKQSWLLGAGVSFESNIPPIAPLTRRVESELKGTDRAIFDAIKKELPNAAHVEDVLSHIGDLIAVAERSKAKATAIGGSAHSVAELTDLYRAILGVIGLAVRYGYKEAVGTAPAEVGTIDKPIVKIEHHIKFVESLALARANLEERSAVNFFTINYDTLLEDALALRGRVAIDGFTGGAIGFWNPGILEDLSNVSPHHHRIFKLHGSVDWRMNENRGPVRCRYGVAYFTDPKDILIYPQATKYVETQKDPFAVLFSGLRRALQSQDDHALLVCGYSFGDNHVNNEIEYGLSNAKSKTTLVVFSKEQGDPPELPAILKKWRNNEEFGRRVYVASDKAIYNGKQQFTHPKKTSLDWWSFAGMTEFIRTRKV